KASWVTYITVKSIVSAVRSPLSLVVMSYLLVRLRFRWPGGSCRAGPAPGASGGRRQRGERTRRLWGCARTGPVGAGEWLAGQPWWPHDGPVQAAGGQDVLHLREVDHDLADRGVGQAGAQVPHEEPVTGVVFRRAWVAGRGPVPTAAALTAPMRRTPVTFIAATMAGVPWTTIPASEFECGPSPESTASVPAIADSSVAGSGAARSVVMMHKRVSY